MTTGHEIMAFLAGVDVLCILGWGYTLRRSMARCMTMYDKGVADERKKQAADTDGGQAKKAYADLVSRGQKHPPDPFVDWFFDDKGVLCHRNRRYLSNGNVIRYPELRWPRKGWKFTG